MRGSKRRRIENKSKVKQDHYPTAYRDCMADKFDEALQFRGSMISKKLTAFQGIAIKYVMKKEKMSNRRFKRMQKGKE